MLKYTQREKTGGNVRTVIDTNVLLSGLLWYGAPHTLFDLVRAGTIQLFLSTLLLEEFAEVISRPKFVKILSQTSRTPEHIVHEIRTLADMVTPLPLETPVCRDPDDDAVLACARAVKANLIISGDSDLLILDIFEGIPIVTPAIALQMIKASSNH